MCHTVHGKQSIIFFKRDLNLIFIHIKYKPYMHICIHNKGNQKYIHWWFITEKAPMTRFNFFSYRLSFSYMGVSKVFLLYVTKALPEPNCRSMGSRKNQGAGLIHQAIRGQPPMSKDTLSQLGVGLPCTGYTFRKIYFPESTSSGWALQNIIISHFYIVGKKMFF